MMSSPRISALTTGMSRSAAMQARAKNDMKPSPMPCCFWKRSLCSARSAITALMSSSLKVVRMAAVCCAWTRRSAIRRRIGLSGTRSSPSARAADGCGAAGTSIRTGRALRSRYASTSSLVSRPPLPEAGTRVGSRSCSARRRRTAGLSGPTPRAATGSASASAGARGAAGMAGAGFGVSGAAGAGFGAAGAAARAPPSSSMRATSSPTATFSPAAFTMRSTPARSAGSSMLALSVSSSSRMSSGLTASPSCFAQRTMTPSVTDSPSVGMRTSNAMPPSASAPLSAGERGVHQVALLGLVELERAGRGARGLGTPGVVEGAVLGQDAPESPVHDVPRAHVPRLLLHPVHLTRFGVGGEDGLELLRREGIELLDAHERHGVDGALAARGEELVVDLAAAEQDAPHPAALDRDPGLGRAAERDVVDHGPEPALRQLFERRDAELVAEQALRAHEDERLAEAPVHLAAEGVEVLPWRGQVADLHVVLGAELEEALEARARVLGALALVAVREEQHEAAHALPLRLRAGEELVDDHLRAVDEVAELRLPDDQPARVGEAHAELEAEDGVLGQHAVDDAERHLVAPDVVERNVAVAGLDVVEDGVALAEGAAAGVLPAHADRDALEQERADGERLGAAPVDGPSLAHHLRARLHEARDPRVRREALGQAREGGGDLPQHLGRDGRPGAPVVARPAEALPEAAEAEHGLARHEVARVALRVVEQLAELARPPLRLLGGDRPRLDQLLAVEREGRPLGGDLLVHHRLREGRIVELVVPVPAVADEVDEDVLLEALAKADGQAGRLHRGLGVVAVHVEDGRLDDLGDVARVGGEAVRLGRRREADLVVDDDVHRAAGAVAVELGEPESLGHHTLAGEGRVAVHENGHDARVLGVVQVLLLGAHHALDDRIDCLEMARVGGEREVDLPPRARGVVARVAEVILDVAVPGRLLGEETPLELRDDHLVVLAEHVGEHVDPPAVRHAEDHLLDAERARVLDQRVEEGDERVAALEREALGGRVADLEELLEALGGEQAVEDDEPVLPGEVGTVGGRLHALLEPDALLLVLDVHVLDAERAAVGGLQASDQVADAGARAAAEAAARDDAVEILVAEAELRGLEERMPCGLRRERVQIGDQMPELAVGVDQVEDADDRRAGRARRGRADGGPVAAGPQLEAREEERPLLADRARVGLVAAVLLGDVVLVGERDAVDAFHPRFFLASLWSSRHPGGVASPGCGRYPLPRMAPVVYLVRDLVFVSKIREAAARLGLEVERAADAAALQAAAREAKLVIVDLRLPEALDALAHLAVDPLTARVRAVGFVDHEQVEAMEARGCGTVLAKGRFASELPSLLAACRS